MTRLVCIALAVASLALVALGPAGCSPGSRQTTVTETRPSADASGALTPIERGAIRRDVLAAVDEAMEAFVTDDPALIALLWPEDYAGHWAKLRAEAAAQGRKRVRVHTQVSRDVTTLDQSGLAALVEYDFVNGSHYIDSAGATVEGPESSESVIVQLTVQKTEAGWRVVRMIGSEESLR